MKEHRPKKLLVSILSLGRPENIQRQWLDLAAWLSRFAAETRTAVHVAVRNNHPGVSFDEVAALLEQTRAGFPDLEATLFTGGPNLGFGGGHNENFRLIPSDFFLILNDDIGFPHLNWLAEALGMLEKDRRKALVADAGSPQHLSPFFGNGSFPGQHHLRTLKYGEASILLVRSAVFAELGMFDPKIDWAMCEDADLSLKAQQHGYRLAWLPIPHQHWRSTSFNSLPGSVRSSILEHNRATLFATWRHTLTTGSVGRFVVYDLWSDGIGDIFCALPHLAAELRGMTPQQRANVVINTPRPELLRLLGAPDVRTTRFEDIGLLQAALAADGIAAIHSIRDVNYSLPLDIHALICGALGLRAAGAAQLAEFRDRLLAHEPAERLPAGLTPRSYCVLHLEFVRNGHHGRALSAARARDLLRACAQVFDRVVLVGKERRLVPPDGDALGRVLDLQGAVSQDMLLALIAHAQAFVGIDSFPAHVAQAAGVPAAVFFGSVHPLARVWNQQQVWPLVAGPDCIGCYHTHLEPSVPFCMRYDDACTDAIERDGMVRTLEMMAAGTPFDWSSLTTRFRGLQAKLMHLLRHHPAPPQRLFRAHAATNEQISNLIYETTDKMAEMLRGQYQTAAMRALSGRIADLEAQAFAQAADLDEARRQLRHRLSQPEQPLLRPAPSTTRILPITDIDIAHVRCRIEVREQWLEIASSEDDPQLYFPALEGHGGRVRLRLTCMTDKVDLVQLFWAFRMDGFSLAQMDEIAVTGDVASLDRSFDVAEGESLYLRIDPLAGAGRMRLRGSITGSFRQPAGTAGHDPTATDAPGLLSLPPALADAAFS